MKVDPSAVRALYNSGLSQTKIALELGCSRSLVDAVMRANGIAARNFRDACPNMHRLIPDEEAAIRADYASGMPLINIMHKHDLSEKILKRVLKPVRRSISESNRTVTQRHKHLLVQEQLDVLYGTLLGDACLYLDGHSIVYSVSHCQRQAGYSDHIFDAIGHGSIGWVTQRSGFSIGARVRAFKYRNKAALQDIWDVIMINGRKSVTSAWLSRLTPATLAYWFMDDGSSVRVGYQKRYVRITFATYSFTRDEVEMLRSGLLKFGFRSSMAQHKHGLGIRLSQSDSMRFMNLIAPTMRLVPCLAYKLKYPSWQPDME